MNLGVYGGFSSASRGVYGGNDMGASLGGWAAYTFGSRVSLGLESIYFFGHSNRSTLLGVYDYTRAASNLHIAATVGVDLSAGPFTFKPYAFVGAVMESLSCEGFGCPYVDTRYYSAWHGTVGLGLGFRLTASVVMFGVDFRGTFIADTHTMGAVLGTLGVRIPN